MSETDLFGKAITIVTQYAGPVGVLLVLVCSLLYKLYKDERKERIEQGKAMLLLYKEMIEDNKKISNILANLIGRG